MCIRRGAMMLLVNLIMPPLSHSDALLRPDTCERCRAQYRLQKLCSICLSRELIVLVLTHHLSVAQPSFGVESV